MVRLRYIAIICIALVINAASALAQSVGCLSNGTGTFYTTVYSGSDYDYNGASYANGNTVFCLRPTGVPCRIRYVIVVPLYAAGMQYTYGPLPCPIDDYLWLFIIPASTIGIYTLRRGKSCAKPQSSNN